MCPVCQVNTKDALSDTPPDVPSKREELPVFMITYKPEREEDKEEQGCSTKVAESSQSNNSNNAQPSAAVKDLEPNNEEKAAINDPASSTAAVEDVPAGIIQPQVLSVHDMSTDANSNNAATTSQQSIASPLWLDALIAGLVSFIVVLVCRRYVF